MKNCAYCGRENSDAALGCQECGTGEFKSPKLAEASPQAQELGSLASPRMTSTSTFERKRSLLTWLCVLSPFLLGLVYVTMGLHIRLGLGHLPRPMIDDYQTLAFRVHVGTFFVIMCFTCWAAIPLWIFFLCFRAFRISWRAHIAQAFAFGIGLILFQIAFTDNSSTFAKWFLYYID